MKTEGRSGGKGMKEDWDIEWGIDGVWCQIFKRDVRTSERSSCPLAEQSFTWSYRPQCIVKTLTQNSKRWSVLNDPMDWVLMRLTCVEQEPRGDALWSQCPQRGEGGEMKTFQRWVQNIYGGFCQEREKWMEMLTFGISDGNVHPIHMLYKYHRLVCKAMWDPFRRGHLLTTFWYANVPIKIQLWAQHIHHIIWASVLCVLCLKP